MQIKRREALAAQQKRNWAIAVVVAITLVSAIAATTIWVNNRQKAIAPIKVSQNRITFANDSGDNFTDINRQERPHFYHRVTLQKTPQSHKLFLVIGSIQRVKWCIKTATKLKLNLVHLETWSFGQGAGMMLSSSNKAVDTHLKSKV